MTAFKPRQAAEAIVFALLTAALILPLYDVDIGSTPLFTKAVIFQGLVLAAAAFWLSLARAVPAFRPAWRSPIVIAATLLLAVSAVSCAFGVDPSRSLWSTSIRMTGLVGQASAYLYFLMASTFLRQEEYRRLLPVGAGLVSAAVGVLALREYHLLHEARVMTVLDNAGFLGGYAAVGFWLALAAASQQRTGLSRLAFLAAALLNLAAVFLSGSRGPLLAILLSAAVVGLAACLASRRTTRRRWTLALGLVGLCLGVGLAFSIAASPAGRQWVSRHLPPAAARVLYANVGEDRLALWDIAWRAFQLRPVLGWGPENFQSAFDLLAHPTGGAWMLDAGWYDRPHNLLMQRLVDTGFLGLLATLFMLLAVAGSLRRAWTSTDRDDRDRRGLVLAVAGALMAYAIHAFFLFEVPAVSTMMAVALGLLVALTESPRPSVHPERPFSLALAAAALLTVAPLAWFACILPYRQTSAYNRLEAAFLDGSTDSAAMRTLFSGWSPARRDLVQKFCDRLRFAREAEPEPRADWRELILLGADVAARDAKAAPHDYRTLMVAAAASRLASEYQPTQAAQADALLDRALLFGPDRLKAFEERGSLCLAQRDYDGAITAFKVALGHTAIANQLGRLHFRLAQAQLGAGRLDAALREYRASLTLGYDHGTDLALLRPLAEALPMGGVDPAWIAYADGLADVWGQRRSSLEDRALIYAKAGLVERSQAMVDDLMLKDADRADRLQERLRGLSDVAP